MQSWPIFLQQQGAGGIDALTGAVADFANPASGATTTLPATNFMTPLCDAALIVASGADAPTFLHNQLTNDVANLGLNEARLAGYCTPKGRLLATLLAWRTGNAVLLQLPLALQPTIRKRLQMFVLRAKVTLCDAEHQTVQLGLVGPAAAVLTHWFPALPATAYAKVENDAGTLIRLADSIQTNNEEGNDDADKKIPAASGAPISSSTAIARYVWVAQATTLMAAWDQLTMVLQPSGSAAWKLARVRAGIPLITPPTQEQFVPQMINYEAIGGVSFRKGCYPGQEIVARGQYLGTLKRRMLPATVASVDVAAGCEVYSSADPTQACGMVVEAAPSGPGASMCLVSLKLAALEATVHLGNAQGAPLTFGMLPYRLSDTEH